jgi:glutathione synthase/RimK-type ligase-like ATP-grasp enzyme
MGGYPVIVKVLGSSGGIGIMRLDSPEALYSVVDHLIAQRMSPLLCAYVDNAVHWRLIVIGDRVAAAYRNVGIDRDFRSAVSSAAEDYGLEPPAEMAAVATRAVALLHLEFGGVDLLEHPTGRIYLLEVNFPCFFAQPQMTIGTDLGGMMVDHLIAKSRRLARG